MNTKFGTVKSKNTRLHTWEATLAALISGDLSALQGARANNYILPYSKSSVFPQLVEKIPDFGKIFYKHSEKANLF